MYYYVIIVFEEEKIIDEEVNKTIGERLKLLREDRNISQKVLARQLQMISGGNSKKTFSESTIGRYEKGKISFSISLIKKLCKIFDVEIYYFLKDRTKVVLKSDSSDDSIVITLNKRSRNKILTFLGRIESIKNNKILDMILNLINEVIALAQNKDN